MNLASSIDGDLVTGANRETRVVVGPVVHKALASSRVSLLIKRAQDGELAGHADLEETRGRLSCAGGLRRSFLARSELGVDHAVRDGTDTMLDVGPRKRLGVLGLDVEDNGHNVHLKPETGAQIRRLGSESA